MTPNSERVKEWRRATKRKMVESMGGKCVCCGYAVCDEALDFHHLDPSQKELKMGGVRSNCASWNKVCTELRKCVLVCANCHREIESGNRDVPNDAPMFDESYAKFREFRSPMIRHCITCNIELNTFHKSRRYCSETCKTNSPRRLIQRRKHTWPDEDTLHYDMQSMSWLAMGKKYGVSDNAVRKWAKSYKLL